MDENNNMNTPEKPTPMWKRILALVGVAAVLGFVAWLFFTMLSL